MVEQETNLVEMPESGEPTVIEVAVPPSIPPNRPRKVYAGMWGPLEIAAVAVGSLAVVIALVVYFVFVIPSNRELVNNRAEADRLEAEQMSAKSKYGEITSTQGQVTKLVESVDDFQSRFLPASENGQAALYQRLNGLIASYDLTNTTGPDYAPLETIDLNPNQQASEEERGRGKFRSLFPGVYVTVTLEGSYQNLRRFIREIETGREFVVVSSVELAPSDSDGKDTKKDQSNPVPGAVPAGNPTAPLVSRPTTVINPSNGKPMAPGFNVPVNQPFAQPAAQQPDAKHRGKMHGEVVSLHIELAAYFRRTGFVPMPTAPSQQ